MPDDRPPIQPKTVDVNGAADILGVSVKTIRRLVDEGSLRHIPIPTGRGTGAKRLIRFRESDLDAFLDAAARGGTPMYADVARGRIDGQFKPDPR